MTVLAVALAIAAAMNQSMPVNPAPYETATFAGGCFWGLQESLRQIPGVIKTTAGYTGGTTPNPTYELVSSGKTGHVEAVQVVFDPARLSYEQLLADFLTSPVPARLATGTDNAHRPAIFYRNAEQNQAAEHVKDKINQSGKGNRPMVVEIDPASAFYPAEECHQDYYRKNSASTTCVLP